MKLEVNIDKKYFFILLGVLIVIGGIIGVYAVLGTTPNPGHAISELQPCSNGEILKMGTSGWTCGTDNTGSTILPGTWCGLRMTTAAYVSCNGFDPAVSCPTGYTSVFWAAMGGLGGNWYTCYKN